MIRYIWGLGLSILCCSSLTAAKLISVTLKQEGNNPSVVFTLDSAVPHRVFTLTNPNRVVVDFENTLLAANLNQVNLDKRLIKAIRSGHPNPYTLRLVFEINQLVNTKTKPMPKHRFALDLIASHPLTPKTAGLQTIDPKPSPNRQVLRPKPPLRDVIVVLDPGHGGKDPGASGPRRALEKQVTLAIAKRLKQIIDRQAGMKAVLTRSDDYYIELRERLKIARKYNADIFISIHADAFINQHSSGASVFALSQSGATSEAARWLAEKENYSELGGVNLAELDDQTGLVRTVLIDLSQTATIGASLHMGEQVLRHLEKMTRLHNDKVEQARFMVLKSPDIPSILIETGFISNPTEEAKLTNSVYQARLTEAIFAGLRTYFYDYPLYGTRIEALSGSQFSYLVQKGDSLPKIAAKYHVSVAALISANRLSGSLIRIGQRLVIPKIL